MLRAHNDTFSAGRNSWPKARRVRERRKREKKKIRMGEKKDKHRAMGREGKAREGGKGSCVTCLGETASEQTALVRVRTATGRPIDPAAADGRVGSTEGGGAAGKRRSVGQQP